MSQAFLLMVFDIIEQGPTGPRNHVRGRVTEALRRYDTVQDVAWTSTGELQLTISDRQKQPKETQAQIADWQRRSDGRARTVIEAIQKLLCVDDDVATAARPRGNDASGSSVKEKPRYVNSPPGVAAHS